DLREEFAPPWAIAAWRSLGDLCAVVVAAVRTKLAGSQIDRPAWGVEQPWILIPDLAGRSMRAIGPRQGDDRGNRAGGGQPFARRLVIAFAGDIAASVAGKIERFERLLEDPPTAVPYQPRIPERDVPPVVAVPACELVRKGVLAGATNTGGDTQGDVLSNIENLEGSAYNDTLTGNAGDNWIYGEGGADTIDGGAGFEPASYFYSAVGVTVSLVAGAVNTGGDAQGDVLTNIEDLEGSAFNDTLTGNAGDNFIYGAGGADTIDGGAGIDTASYFYSAAAVNVSLVAGAANTGSDAQGDVLSNMENLDG